LGFAISFMSIKSLMVTIFKVTIKKGVWFFTVFESKNRATNTLVGFLGTVSSIFTIWSLGKKGVSQAKLLFLLSKIFMVARDTPGPGKKFLDI